MPKEYKTAVLSTSSPKSAIQFNSITSEDEPIVQVERRLAPTRRQPRNSKQQIERRVSSDRRRQSFSQKA